VKDAAFSRVHPETGWLGGKRRPCRHCGAEPPKGRRTFCSDACVDAWKVRSNPGYAAQRVLARDKGVCAVCSIDCVALLEELRQLRRELRVAAGHFDVDHSFSFELEGDHAFGRRVRELGLAGARLHLARRLWEMDHTTPVVEGGGSCGLDNLRTLCWQCHRTATGLLRRRLADKKRGLS
jgi:5-methylcytosine-specific restriction protein A